MKKIIFVALAASCALTLPAHAGVFDHSAIQRGAISMVCYRDPCSVVKVLGFRQLQRSETQSMIELKVLGGEKKWGKRNLNRTMEKKNISWNSSPHSIIITCSKTAPAWATNGYEEVLPLNPNGVPGRFENSAHLYFQACHAYEGASGAGAARFGYNVLEVLE